MDFPTAHGDRSFGVGRPGSRLVCSHRARLRPGRPRTGCSLRDRLWRRALAGFAALALTAGGGWHSTASFAEGWGSAKKPGATNAAAGSPASSKSAIAARAAEASARASATAPTVRMTFLNEPWPDVLKKVAAATESTLVMDEIPPGRVNRLDRKQYTRGEAVASLNRDLERLGYRLLEKGDHLVLFSLRDLRTDYRRPAYPTNQPGSIGVTRPGSPPMSAGGRGGPNSTTNSGRGPIRQIGAATSDYDDPTDPPTSPSTAARATGPQLSGAVSRATLPRGVGPARSEANGAAPAGVHPIAAMPAKPVEIKVTLKSRKALDVARTIFEGSKPQAALVDDGPAGLPGFVVRGAAAGRAGATSSNNEAPVDYTVGIDSDANELIVSAPDARAKQIERLVHTLDEKPLPKDHAERLAPFAGDSARLAGQLQQTMIRLAQATSDDVEKPVPSGRKAGPNVNATKTNGAKSDRSVKSDDPADDPPEARPNSARNDGRQIGPNEGRQPGPNEGRDAAPPQVASPPVQLNLQGPVTVRDVPGVGLVVTGAKADVDAVLGVIRVLELAGTTATPDIHLLGLQNVNSEALAELLTLVYDAMSEVRAPLIGEQRKSVRFVPVVKPNAILIIAPSREMESVLELAEALDQPVDPEAEVEVFRLQYAVASQVVASIDTFYQDRKPMGARVKSFADPRTNSIVVHARPNDLKEVARIVKKIDVGTSGAVARMRIFPLKNATATELATLINAAVQSVLRPPPTPTALPGQQATGQAAGGSTPTQLSDVKSTILEFLSTDGDQEKLIRSGILADIRVTADAGRNTLIVSAPEASLPLIEALIEQLDQPTPLVAEIKVFTLANSSAVTTVDLLRQLFTGQTQQQQGGQFGGQFNNLAAQQGGLQLAGAEGAGAGLIPLRFTTDARTNTIIAIGSASALEIVEAILLKIDASDVRERKKTVIKLRNTFAADVATAVNQFLAAQRDLAQLDPNLVSTVELLEREVIVVPELVSNSLILSATPRYFQEAVDLIEKLDRRPKEVVIQALLVEVTLTNNDEYGVELGLQDSVLFRRTIPNLANNNLPGFLFNNQQLGNNLTTPDSRRVGGQSLTNFSLNRSNGDLGFGGMVLSASSESVSVLIRALSSKRTVHILSRPQIRTLDNQIAQILVGQQVPVATGVATTGLTAASPQVQLRDVGIVLNVIPRISPDGTIVMEVAATSSSVSATRVPIFTDINTGNTVDSPIINVTSAQATISVPNGQTVVLGGMITKQDDAFERKVPWLGDLPYIGNVFRYEGVNARRSELLVFLTPRVVRHEADSELIKRVEAERLHFIERDAEEIHGPLYSAPPPEWYLNRPQSGETPFDPRSLNDRNDVPTTIMPSFPDGSVQPLPNGPTETAPPPTPVPPEPGLDRPAGTPRPPEPEPGRLRLDEPAGPPGQAGRPGGAARQTSAARRR